MAGLQDIDKAVQNIRSGKTLPVYLIYGDQDFLVRQAYDRICEALVPENLRAFNFEQLDGNKAEVGEIMDSLQTLPMMPGPKVVAVAECRFLLSKNQAADMLAKAKEKWDQQDFHGSLRLLAKVLVLADTDWEGAEGWQLDDFKKALNIEIEESKLGGDWLPKALMQGKGAGVALPKGGDDSQELLARLESILEAEGAKTQQFLVLAAPSADGRKKLYKFIETRGLILDFKSAEKGFQLSQSAGTFLANLASQRGLSLDASLSQRLVLAYGQDLGMLAKELEKMEAYSYPRKQLHASDLEVVGSPRMEEDVFELLGALGKKDLASVLPLLQRQLQTQPPQMLLALLSKEVRLLFLCRCLVEEGFLAGKLPDYIGYRNQVLPKLIKELPKNLSEYWKKTHAFVTFQAFTRCRRFDLNELRRALELVLEADVRLKTSSQSPQELLEELCIQLCGVRPEVRL